MHIAKDQIPAKIDVPGAKARQLPDFGIASGTLGAEYFSLGEGTDIAPLLEGLEGDLCQAPHWGYLIEGEVVVSYADGSHERCITGDLFHWPSGHSVRVERAAEVILFSPQDEHAHVMDHMLAKMTGATA
jgi:hypothetical protein